METITYNLRLNNNDSSRYYTDVNALTDAIKIEYAVFAEKNTLEIQAGRPIEDDILALLVFSVFVKNYYSVSRQFNFFELTGLKIALIIKQISVTFNNNFLRKLHDLLKGRILKNKFSGTKSARYDIRGLEKLGQWMRFSGDFYEESKVFLRFLHTVICMLPRTEADITSFLDFGEKFEELSSRFLDKYLVNVDGYIKKESGKHKGKEDYLLCNRKKNEYYLNMLGAELLGRSFLSDFSRKRKKIILLPFCMTDPVQACKAIKTDLGYTCIACSPGCATSKITKACSGRNEVRVYVVRHGSESLKIWHNESRNNETAIVGITCVLNLLNGGLQGKTLNMPVQCILLDYCGCKNHWSDTGVVTAINETRLYKILGVES
jgi:uncharacterized protein